MLAFMGAMYVWQPRAAVESDTQMDTTNWKEYGRIEKGEVALSLGAKQEDHKILVTLTFTNQSDRLLHLFKIRTGKDGKFFNAALEVKHNGNAVAYAGPMMSIAPAKSWYIDLEPKETFTNTVEITEEYYPMDLKPGDTVEIGFKDYGDITETVKTTLTIK